MVINKKVVSLRYFSQDIWFCRKNTINLRQEIMKAYEQG